MLQEVGVFSSKSTNTKMYPPKNSFQKTLPSYAITVYILYPLCHNYVMFWVACVLNTENGLGENKEA